jgi:alkaline phosphatase D
MPVRLPKPIPGEPFTIHRTVRWGGLMNMAVLDGRQYRDPQPTDGEPIELPGVATIQTIGPTANDPNHSMLGLDQRRWVMDQLAMPASTWTVLANQVYMHGINAVPIGTEPAINTDTWDGYHAARRMLLESISSDNNVVVLTGDFHAATVADLRADPYDASLPVTASEFMAPAISSQFPAQLRPLAPLALIANPHVKHFEPDNGYMTCAVNESTWTTELFVLDDVADEDSAVSLTARFTVDAGRPGIASTQILKETA